MDLAQLLAGPLCLSVCVGEVDLGKNRTEITSFWLWL